MGGPRIADRLNANQRRVLDLLLTSKPYIVKFRDIGLTLGLGEASVRTVLRRLAALSFLSFKKARDGNIQGVAIVFNQHVVEQYQKDIQEGHTADQTEDQTPGQSPSHTAARTASQTGDQSAGQTPGQPDSELVTKPVSQPAPLEIDRKESLSIESDFGWDDAFLELMWPRVHQAGFRLEQIRQAVAARARVGKDIDRESLTLSLDRADWELEEKGQLAELATGGRVRNVGAYIYTALARWGVLRAHPEYVSREETAAAAAADELRRRREAADALETARFEQYLADLSPEALLAAMAGFPGGSREAWLKNHWRRQVRDAS